MLYLHYKNDIIKYISIQFQIVILQDNIIKMLIIWHHKRDDKLIIWINYHYVIKNVLSKIYFEHYNNKTL